MAEPVVQKRLTVEVLAPLHIGSGDRLRRKDFVRQRNQVFVAEPRWLLERVEREPRLSQAFLAFCEDEGQDLYTFLRNNRIRFEEVAYQLFASGQVGGEISPFIKTGDHRPYLPGSSIKGALRSALLHHALRSDPDQLTQVSGRVGQGLRNLRTQIEKNPGRTRRLTRQWRQRISEGVERSFFGPDQHHDLMRCIQISDSATVDLSNLQVAEVRVLSVGGNRLVRKQTRRGRDMLINPEVATKGAFEGSLTFNLNLISDRGPASKLGFHPKRDVVLDFASACNEVAEALIEQEIAFYDTYGETTLVDWYRRLGTQVSKLREGQCLLYMAWGSGFDPKAIAGLFDDALLDETRLAFELGKIVHKGCGGEVRLERRPTRGREWYCFKCRRGRLNDNEVELTKPFPKSRKVVFESGRPSKPLGWVKLTVE